MSFRFKGEFEESANVINFMFSMRLEWHCFCGLPYVAVNLTYRKMKQDEREPESAAPLSKTKRKSKPVRSRIVRPKKQGQYILKNLKVEEESRWCDSSSAQSSVEDESSQDKSESLAGEEEDLHRSKSLVSSSKFIFSISFLFKGHKVQCIFLFPGGKGIAHFL